MAEKAPLSFAQIAASEEVATPLRVVQIDGLVVLKIIKHCKDFMPALVTGQLLGLDIGSVLEVTNCFPFPSRGGEEEEEIEADGANYQLEMMRCFREVNVDNNTVGWYQSTFMGSYQTAELIETFLNYQENIKRCVCIIYDPQRSGQGVLALKALKLTDPFMELFRNQNFTGEKLREQNLTWQDIFQEIPSVRFKKFWGCRFVVTESRLKFDWSFTMLLFEQLKRLSQKGGSVPEQRIDLKL
ncbi:hypothetical protein L7F22_031219 [Adiantum nelumboides]|nr:hypothetical protein [Adiantum nelumboides]